MEEVLRNSSPAQDQGRTVTTDIEWYGQTVPSGARILLLNASANRDEPAASHATTLDESRCTRVHMSNVHGYESVPFAAER